MKVFILAIFVAVANAGNLGVPVAPIAATPLFRSHITHTPIATAPVVAAKAVEFAEDYDPNPQYSYAYDIQDALTGDSKNHFESRNGDAVQGSYSLIDADGTRRIVEYTADPINGFNAVVHREPLGVAAPIASPVAYAAPYAKIATPLIHTKTFLH